MRRGPTGSLVLGGVALAGAAGLLAVTVLQAVSVDPVGPGVLPADAVAEADAGKETDAVDAGHVGNAAAMAAEVAPEAAAPISSRDRTRRAAASPDDPYVPERPRAGPDRPFPPGASTGPDRSDPPAAWDDPLALAVDNDPFSPERRAPARRYRLPAERVPVVSEEPRERPEAPDFRVVGSAAVGGGGLALVQVDRDEPRLVVLGESVRGYTLAAVDGESATLVGPAGSLRFPVLEPLAARDDDDDRRRRGRDDDEERIRRAREAMEQQLQRMRQQMLRLRGNVPGGVRWNPDGSLIRIPQPVDVAPTVIRVDPRRRGGGGGPVPERPDAGPAPGSSGGAPAPAPRTP